jgi:DNA-binding MarR family transcriptional regulator
MATGAQTRSAAQQLRPDIVRAALAVRELRRATGTARFRDSIFGDLHVLDIGQQDALEVVVTLGGARMSEVAQALRVDPSTATRAIARIEALGLVERRPDPDDGRSVVAVATDAGLSMLDALHDRASGALGRLYDRFDEQELETLAELLERLVDGVDELAEAPGP